MKIRKNGDLFVEAEVAENILEKIRGLMFRELDDKEALLLKFPKEKRWGIWMAFVPQDLALLFLDKEKEIVDKKLAEKLSLDPRSWKIYKPVERCKYVLECNPGKIEEAETGEKLEW